MTTKELKKLIEAQLEDEATPKKVLAWAEANQGKPIRSNNVPEGLELDRRHNMTHLITPDYWGHNAPRPKYSFLVAYTETGATVPTPEKLKELACCYYAGIVGRNTQRREALADISRLDEISNRITKAERALVDYQSAYQKVEDIIGSRLDFPEWYTIEAKINICGFKNEYGHKIRTPNEQPIAD